MMTSNAFCSRFQLTFVQRKLLLQLNTEDKLLMLRSIGPMQQRKLSRLRGTTIMLLHIAGALILAWTTSAAAGDR